MLFVRSAIQGSHRPDHRAAARLCLRREHVGNPKFDGYLTMRRCTSAHVESPVDLTVCVDGEIFKSNSVDIKIIPASLPFLVPAAD